MQYRMQAHTRRAVTRQYLALPMEWHQRHPTGQLLSNANSDVEAAWGPIAPLPMAVGTLAMMVIAIVQMFVADVVMALVGLLVFPAVIVANLAYQRLASPLMTRAQQLRAELSEVAHESFDGAMVVKTLGREAEETARFAAKAHELRDINIRAGRIRAAFDPTLAALPNLGVLIVLAVGVERVLNGHTDAGDVVTVAYLLTIVSFPIRSIGWLLGEFPRSVVGFQRVQRGAARRPARCRTATSSAATTPARAPGSRSRVSATPTSPDQPLLDDVTFAVEPGRTVAVVGATASGKSTLTTLMTRLVDPDDGRVLLDGTDLRDLAAGELAETVAHGAAGRVPLRRHRPRQRHARAPTSPTTRSGRRCAPPRPTASSRPCPTGSTAGSASAARRCPAASASGSRWPARWSVSPRLLILDDATSAVDPEVEARILAALRVGRRRHARWSWSPTARPPSGWPTRSSTSRTAGSPTAAPTPSCCERSPAYARLVNAYEQRGRADRMGTVEQTSSTDAWTPARRSARSRPSVAACTSRPSSRRASAGPSCWP